MKKTVYYILLFGLLGYWASGQYYEITTNIYTPGLTLNTGDSLYMTNGGFDSLTLFGSSTAAIQGTSPLQEGSGGIWLLSVSNTSRLEISGGQINHLDLNSDATVTLAGGTILEIESNQDTERWDNDNGTWIQTPHVTVVCSTHAYDASDNLLTGNWLNGTPFRIQLIDVDGYNPAIDNIQFIPEPAAIALLGFGGLLLKRTGNRSRGLSSAV